MSRTHTPPPPLSSEGYTGCDLRNNISCDSLGLLCFVPKCAQNVPTGAGVVGPANTVRRYSVLPRRRATSARLNAVQTEQAGGRRTATDWLDMEGIVAGLRGRTD